MPTRGWLVYGESGDTLVLNRTAKAGNVRLRVIQGDKITSAVVPARELRTALEEFCAHEESAHGEPTQDVPVS